MSSPWQRIKQLFAREPVPSEHRKRVRQPAYERSRYLHSSVMPGMEPSRLARVLREVDSGNYENYLTAAQELEERDAQYGPALAVRRTAVAALELTVYKPEGANARATKAARELLDSKALKPFIGHLLDALGKGFSIAEIVWTEKHGKWVPTFVEHDPREFCWHDGTGVLGSEVYGWRLRDSSPFGLELAPGKWVIHEPKLRAGIPIRRGLARAAMFLHMAKSMSLAGWVTLMRVFGVPLAIASLPEHETKAEDAAVIRTALAGLGQGINALVPNGTEVEIINAAAQGSPEKMFSVLLDYVDKQISKLVLGQTMTADNGASHAQATVHNDVRKDIREGDAEDLAHTINEYLVKPYIDFNVGPQRAYPEVFFVQPDTDDLDVWTSAVDRMAKLGLPVKADEVYAKLGLTRPAEGDAVIGGRLAIPKKPPPPAGDDSELSVASTRRRYRRRPTTRPLAARLR